MSAGHLRICFCSTSARARCDFLKTPSTPSDQSVGILNGIQQLIEETGVAASDIGALLHGTTVSTNIVLEEKGAKVGLLVTENFEQVLHLARSQTPGPLAGWIIMQKPDPLADLELTRGIRERVNARGDVITPLDEASARKAIQELIDLGAEAITVSLMHSYANPQHEQRLKALVEEIAPDMTVSLSSEILPEFREYERTLVTVMNAYVRPSMRRYLSGFEEKLHRVQFQSERQYRALRRRPDERRARQPIAGAHDAVRPGRRRIRCGVHGVARRLPAGARLRHGRHLHRRLAHSGRQADDLAADGDRLLSDQGAVGRRA